VNRVEKKLAELGLALSAAKMSVANYLGIKCSDNSLYVSACVSEKRGQVGTDVSNDEAKLAARNTLLDLLAIIKAEIGGLDRVGSILKM